MVTIAKPFFQCNSYNLDKVLVKNYFYLLLVYLEM